ncbi:MAG: radical SAM protein [Candidatus Gracilibacteria bacterium]|nr:radical SAM protein [Candidatus Gracilibacteria bacterium]
MMYKRADVKVGFACNNHCTFCVQGDKRERFKPRKLEEIQKIIKEEYDAGARYVVFTGGEPTVHPNLVESVQYASDLGYKQIQIQSNGTNFDNLEYVKKLINAGVTEFSPSIHGFNKETHNKQVATPGAWDKVVKGLINLKKLNQYIIINSVVTQDNYKEIPELAALLIKIGVTQFQFAFVHILGSADKNKLTVVPRKKDVMPYIHKALDLAKKANIPAFTEAIPYCLMQGYEWAIAENIMPETAVHDAEYKIDSYADYRWNEGKAKREECKTCSKYNICEGPWKEYPDMYGWEEFKPI